MGVQKMLRVTVRSDGKLYIARNGIAQIGELDDLFCVLVKDGRLEQRYRTASDGITGFTNFTLSDLSSQTSGRKQYISKRASSNFRGSNFHVDYTLSYDTLNPELIVCTLDIDASRLSNAARITITSNIDIKFDGNCDAGGAYIVPNVGNRNYGSSYTRVNEVPALKFFGGRNLNNGSQLKGVFSISRPFALGKVDTYTKTRARVFLDEIYGGMYFHKTYKLDADECKQNGPYNLGVVHTYNDILGATVTNIQTGLLFTDDLAGGLDYTWTNSFSPNSKHKQMLVSEVADLSIRYYNYMNRDIQNMKFDVDLGELTIARSCSTDYMAGTIRCVVGANTYSLSNASLNSTYAGVTIPVRAPHSGVYTFEVSAFRNTSLALPAGSPAILTVNSEVNFPRTRLYPILGSEVAVRVELLAGTSEPQDTRVALKYSGNMTTLFNPRPDTVVIPAGQNYVEFMLRTPDSLDVDTRLDIEITGTDNPYIKTGAGRVLQIVICRAVLSDDAALGGIGQTVIDQLANDLRLPCLRTEMTVSIADVHLRHGSLTVNPDKTITYEATQSAPGIDSFRYVIGCPTPSIPECSNDAWVYIITTGTVAGRYVACPDAELTVAMTHIAGVEYHWYGVRTGGQPLRSNSDSCNTRKSGAEADTLFVEAEYRGIRMSRYAVVIERSEYCSYMPPPSSCVSDGSVIFAEDFGQTSGYILPAVTTEYIPDTLQHHLNIPRDNRYSISEIIGDSSLRHTFSDHTAASAGAGCLMTVNGTDEHRLIYRAEINELCAGIPLSISAWTGNLLKPDPGAGSLLPRMVFTARDLRTNRLLVEYATGDIPEETSPAWKIYGFDFVPESDAILLSIFSRAPAGTGAGNEFVIDDIELRLCSAPSVLTPSPDTLACSGSNVSVKMSYTDNGIYSLPLIIRWEYSPEGSSASWTRLRDDTVRSAAAASTYDITPFAAGNAGVYRAAVGDSRAIDRPRCRVERRVKIDTLQFFHASDIRLRPLIEEIYDTTLIKLSKYIDTVNRKYVEWDKTPVHDPDIIDDITGAIEAYRLKPSAIYTYKYRLNAPCNISAGKAFVKLDSLRNYQPKKTKTLVVCHSDKSSDAIILENVAGVSADGSWSAKSPDPDDVVKKTLSNDSEYSSNIFNARKAYEEAQDPVYNEVHEGKQAKVITLTLEVPVSANAPDEIMDLKIVITD
jgi:hypothetical protein